MEIIVKYLQKRVGVLVWEELYRVHGRISLVGGSGLEGQPLPSSSSAPA